MHWCFFFCFFLSVRNSILSGSKLPCALCAAYSTCLCRLCDVNVNPCLNHPDIWDKKQSKTSFKKKRGTTNLFPPLSKASKPCLKTASVFSQKKKSMRVNLNQILSRWKRGGKQQLLCPSEERKQSAEEERCQQMNGGMQNQVKNVESERLIKSLQTFSAKQTRSKIQKHLNVDTITEQTCVCS